MFRAGVFALGTLPWGIRTLCVKLRGLVDVRVRWFSYHPPCPTEQLENHPEPCPYYPLVKHRQETGLGLPRTLKYESIYIYINAAAA